jgi:hypothetical protein
MLKAALFLQDLILALDCSMSVLWLDTIDTNPYLDSPHRTAIKLLRINSEFALWL